MTTYKNGTGVIAALVLLLGAAGCGEKQNESDGFSRNSSGTVGDVREPGAGEPLDLGDDWMTTATGSGATSGSRSTTVPISGASSSFWSVVLRTFSNDGHQAAARNAAKNCVVFDQRLADVAVHTTPKGSMIIYGRFSGHDDPDASTALEWIKGLQRGGRTVFPRAILTRVRMAPRPGSIRPIDLLALRARYPGVNPLYTLQVGVWGDFESGSLRSEVRRGRADAQVRELRSQGHEAYVHHDEDRNLSMVTVGAFDRTAFDAQSGIATPELERLMRMFPEHMVNGERLMEPIDPRRPTMGTRVQVPRLVLVPER